MQLNIDDLRAISDRLLANLAASGIDSVDLQVDYYWEIPSEQRYDPYTKPDTNSLTLGQVSWDIESLYDVLEGGKIPVAYHLVWLGTVLKAVGEKLVS